MKTRNAFNNRHKLRYNDEFLSADSRINPYFSDRCNKLLFSHKSSLENILKQIKNCQLDYISNKSTKNKNISNAKQILLSFKNSLNSLFNEKNQIYQYYKKENEIKKTNIQKFLFPNHFETEETEKNKKIINDKICYSEINQLKILNFQIENEIQNVDNSIYQKSSIIYMIKTNIFFINNEIYCNYKTKNISEVSDILHDDIKEKRKIFINTAKTKFEKDMEIKLLLMKKEFLKDKIRRNKENIYIITEEIFNEDYKDYTNEINITNNYNKNKHNICVNDKNKIIKMKNNKYIYKNIFFVNFYKYLWKKIFYFNTISPKIINSLYNFINIISRNEYENDNLESECVLKSFNSSLDSDNLSYQNNFQKIQNELYLNESNKNIDTPLALSNENSITDNSNTKSYKIVDNQDGLNENEKIKEDPEYIFTL